jgi:hypothetical protein
MCSHESDPFVTYLKSFGYNPIRMPRANIRPLQLLAKDGKELSFLGDITDVFTGQATVPPIADDNTAANISGQRTGELNIGVAVSLLGNVIGALGGSKLGLELAYKNARTAKFEFPEVLEDRVSVAKLDQYLAKSDVNPNSIAIGKMLDADDVYVTTSCIKSRKFSLEASSESGTTVGVDVPVIQQVVGGSVKVAGSSSNNGKVTFEGNTPIVFGFQAVRLYFDRGRYTALKPAVEVAARALAAAPPDGAERFVAEGAFAALRML